MLIVTLIDILDYTSTFVGDYSMSMSVYNSLSQFLKLFLLSVVYIEMFMSVEPGYYGHAHNTPSKSDSFLRSY